MVQSRMHRQRSATSLHRVRPHLHPTPAALDDVGALLADHLTPNSAVAEPQDFVIRHHQVHASQRFVITVRAAINNDRLRSLRSVRTVAAHSDAYFHTARIRNVVRLTARSSDRFALQRALQILNVQLLEQPGGTLATPAGQDTIAQRLLASLHLGPRHHQTAGHRHQHIAPNASRAPIGPAAPAALAAQTVRVRMVLAHGRRIGEPHRHLRFGAHQTPEATPVLHVAVLQHGRHIGGVRRVLALRTPEAPAIRLAFAQLQHLPVLALVVPAKGVRIVRAAAPAVQTVDASTEAVRLEQRQQAGGEAARGGGGAVRAVRLCGDALTVCSL